MSNSLILKFFLLQAVGCDGTVGSGAELDKCGVCGGNGDTCHVVEGKNVFSL